MLDWKALGAATALSVALAAATPATAGPAGDRLFFEGAYSAVPAGATVRYAHTRGGVGVVQDNGGQGGGAQGEGAQASRDAAAIRHGAIEVALRDTETGKEALVTLDSDGEKRRLNPYPAGSANPLLMLFLESSLRSMSRITGGSAFYIRNRIKDSLRSGGEISEVETEIGGAKVKVEQIVFRPFAADKNRARMGDFADLELRFLLSKETPGGFLLLSAATPANEKGVSAFHEEIAFRDEKKDG